MDRRDLAAEWFEARAGLFVSLRDVAAYSDEFSVVGLIGGQPTAGGDVADYEIAKRLEGAVPKGWCVSVIRDAVLVARDERVMVVNTINAPAGVDSEEMRKSAIADRYVIVVRVLPRMSDAEYQAAAARNRVVAEKIERQEEGMRGIAHKFDEYLPKDERGRAQVSQLEALEGENRALPTHFDAGHRLMLWWRRCGVVRGDWWIGTRMWRG